MKMISKISLAILFSLLLLVSISIFTTKIANGAATKVDSTFGYGLVQCDGVVNPNEPNRTTPCNFAALVNGINYLIYRLIAISIPLATVSFAYAGFLYMSGEQSKIGKAKAIFLNVGVGFIIMITAWFVVTTVVEWVVNKDTGATSLIK